MKFYRNNEEINLSEPIIPVLYKENDLDDKIEVEFFCNEEKLNLVDEIVLAIFQIEDGSFVKKNIKNIDGNSVFDLEDNFIVKSQKLKVSFVISKEEEEIITETVVVTIEVSVVKNKSKRAIPVWNIGEQVVEKNFNKELNVKVFGAKGDGRTDDTAAIQKCFNSIEDRGIIFVPNGTYIVTGIKLTGKKEITITGDGCRSIFKLKDNSQSKYVLNIEDSPRFILKCLMIDGNKGKQKEENAGLIVSRSEFSKIQNNSIMGCKGNGVELKGVFINEVFEGTDEMDLTNNYIYENEGHGLAIDSVSDMIISCNTIEFNKKNGVKIVQTTGIGSGNLSICNNQILSNDIDGIEAENNTSRILLSCNHIRNNGRYGLRWVGGKQLFAVGNNFHINGRINVGVPAVIVGYNNKGFFLGNTFSCADFKPTQSVAIEMYGSKSMYLIGNDIDYNLYKGIYMDKDSDCYCYGNDGIADITNYGLANIYLDTDNTKGNRVPDKTAASGQVFCGTLKESNKIFDGNVYRCKHVVYNILLRCKVTNKVAAVECLGVKVNDIKVGCLTGKDFPEENTWYLKNFVVDAANVDTLKVTIETQKVNANANICVEYVIISPRI